MIHMYQKDAVNMGAIQYGQKKKKKKTAAIVKAIIKLKMLLIVYILRFTVDFRSFFFFPVFTSCSAIYLPLYLSICFICSFNHLLIYLNVSYHHLSTTFCSIIYPSLIHLGIPIQSFTSLHNH